jgi:hypothetical protein
MSGEAPVPIPIDLHCGDMEIDGHPTQDLVEELERRGGLRAEGSSSGPRIDSLRFLNERTGEDNPGLWLFLPTSAFQTEIDDAPY